MFREIEVLERTREVFAAFEIDKEVFTQLTGFSDDQWYRWFNPDRPEGPDSKQFKHMCETLDISASYIMFGYGAMRLSEAKRMWEEDYGAIRRLIDFFQGFEPEGQKGFHETRNDMYQMLTEIHTEQADQLHELTTKVDLIFEAMKAQRWLD